MRNVVLILGAFALAYYVLERQQQRAAAVIGASPAASSGAQTITVRPSQYVQPFVVGPSPVVPVQTAGGVSVTGGIGLGVQGAETGAQVASSLGATSAALTAIPIVGAIASVGLSIVALFTASHQQAVRTEAAVLNSAVPAFFKACDQIMTALDNGTLHPADAKQLLDQAVSLYYQGVSGSGSGHIEKGGPCNLQPSAADCGRAGMKYPHHCNGPCVQACGNIETTVCALKKIIDAGGGSYTFPGTPSHAGFNGYPAVTWTYQAAPASARNFFL